MTTSVWADVVLYTFMAYAFILMAFYTVSGLVAYRQISGRVAENAFTDYRQILTSPLSPKISIIAPAYNEALNIVESIKSLLSLEYHDYEVVIVNDGSDDDTLERLLYTYQLKKTSYVVNAHVPCEDILGVYKAPGRALSKLVVVNKKHGGKSDALNAGINVCTGKYIACIDVDCVLERDALLKLVWPFLNEGDEKVIATGGVIRLANNCLIQDGRLIHARIPRPWILRAQVLEYMRAFFLSRVAWAKANGLLIISGALGMFDKQTVIDAGGYSRQTVGEDIELIIRMRRMMEERNQRYVVRYVPDPLCYTEAPARWRLLARQRNRWTRGLIDALRFHWPVFFNPRYRVMGMISYPYWFFYEWLTPIVETAGIIFTTYLWLHNDLNTPNFLLLLAVIYTYFVFLSMLAIWVDQKTYWQYRGRHDLARLMVMALLEPFFYHPFLVYSALRGNIDALFRSKRWGAMPREGMVTPENAEPVAA